MAYHQFSSSNATRQVQGLITLRVRGLLFGRLYLHCVLRRNAVRSFAVWRVKVHTVGGGRPPGSCPLCSAYTESAFGLRILYVSGLRPVPGSSVYIFTKVVRLCCLWNRFAQINRVYNGLERLYLF